MSVSEMREPTFFILSSLAAGPRHGYAIIAEAADLSDGRLRLQVGTLYAALERLSEKGWVEAAGEEVVSGRNRRYYRLTDTGAAALETEIAQLEARASRAMARLAVRREGFAL